MTTQVNLFNERDHLIPLNVPRHNPPLKLQLMPGDNMVDMSDVAIMRRAYGANFDSMVQNGWIEVLVTRKDSEPDRHAQRQLNMLDDLAKSDAQKAQQSEGEAAGVLATSVASDELSGVGDVQLSALDKLKQKAADNASKEDE